MIQGRIVWACINDPQGRNPKKRRCVVISTPTQINSAPLLRIVGITTELASSEKDHYVELQWGPGARTILTVQSAALATWVYDLKQSRLEITKGHVLMAHVEKILALVEKLTAEGYQIPLEEEREPECK